MSAPLVINLRDGSVWERRAATSVGVALYARAGSPKCCPPQVMATEAELAEHGIAGSADVLPMPVSPVRGAGTSGSITVRVTLDSYDIVHPREKQTQVYVRIPEVACASWLLAEDRYDFLKAEPWPSAVALAQECYVRSGAVSDSLSAASRAAVVEWLGDDAHHDEMYAAWQLAEARRHPMARKLLEENERLRARVAELEARLAEQGTSGAYPPAMPWVKLMDDEDLHDFLDELAASAITHASNARALAEVEATCGRWRAIAEAQHAHNTATGPSADRLTALFAPTQALREEPAPSCKRCGVPAEQWCPDCGACEADCYSHRSSSSCTHSNAPWGGAR